MTYQRLRHPGGLAWLRNALAAGFALLLLTTVAPGPAPAADQAAGKEAELKQIRSRIERVRDAIQNDVQRRDALAGELKSADLEIQSARGRITDVREQRIATERRLKALQQERSETQDRVAGERGALADQLRLAYVNGREEQLKLLLNQQDPARFGRMMAYYGYFGRMRAEHIGQINDHLAHLDLLAEDIAAETERLRDIETQREKEAQALAEARNRRAQTLASVQSKLRTSSDQLAKLQREATALERLLEELRRAAQDFPLLGRQAFERTQGKLPWPVKGEVLARFGQVRSGGPLKWQGIMIGTDRGVQVRAPLHGRVVYSDWLPGMGLLLVLDHGGGYMSLYGHNEQLYRKVGDQVAAGDALAVVGDTGINGRSGLYLEIRKGKQPLNPLSWLRKP